MYSHNFWSRSGYVSWIIPMWDKNSCFIDFKCLLLTPINWSNVSGLVLTLWSGYMTEIVSNGILSWIYISLINHLQSLLLSPDVQWEWVSHQRISSLYPIYSSPHFHLHKLQRGTRVRHTSGMTIHSPFPSIFIPSSPDKQNEDNSLHSTYCRGERQCRMMWGVSSYSTPPPLLTFCSHNVLVSRAATVIRLWAAWQSIN